MSGSAAVAPLDFGDSQTESRSELRMKIDSQQSGSHLLRGSGATIQVSSEEWVIISEPEIIITSQ